MRTRTPVLGMFAEADCSLFVVGLRLRTVASRRPRSGQYHSIL